MTAADFVFHRTVPIIGLWALVMALGYLTYRSLEAKPPEPCPPGFAMLRDIRGTDFCAIGRRGG